jgi:hypothetical protein
MKIFIQLLSYCPRSYVSEFKNLQKFLARWRRTVILWALKIVLGGTTARRNTRCGGLYLFCLAGGGKVSLWRTCGFRDSDPEHC